MAPNASRRPVQVVPRNRKAHSGGALIGGVNLGQPGWFLDLFVILICVFLKNRYGFFYLFKYVFRY